MKNESRVETVPDVARGMIRVSCLTIEIITKLSVAFGTGLRCKKKKKKQLVVDIYRYV